MKSADSRRWEGLNRIANIVTVVGPIATVGLVVRSYVDGLAPSVIATIAVIGITCSVWLVIGIQRLGASSHDEGEPAAGGLAETARYTVDAALRHETAAKAEQARGAALEKEREIIQRERDALQLDLDASLKTIGASKAAIDSYAKVTDRSFQLYDRINKSYDAAQRVIRNVQIALEHTPLLGLLYSGPTDFSREQREAALEEIRRYRQAEAERFHADFPDLAQELGSPPKPGPLVKAIEP